MQTLRYIVGTVQLEDSLLRRISLVEDVHRKSAILMTLLCRLSYNNISFVQSLQSVVSARLSQ